MERARSALAVNGDSPVRMAVHSHTEQDLVLVRHRVHPSSLVQSPGRRCADIMRIFPLIQHSSANPCR